MVSLSTNMLRKNRLYGEVKPRGGTAESRNGKRERWTQDLKTLESV